MGLTVVLPGVEPAVVAGVAGTPPSAPVTLPQASEFVALLAALFQQAGDHGTRAHGVPGDENKAADKPGQGTGPEGKPDTDAPNGGASVAFLLGLGAAPILVTLPEKAAAPAVAQSAVIAPRPAPETLTAGPTMDSQPPTMPAGTTEEAPANSLPPPAAAPSQDVPVDGPVVAGPPVQAAATAVPDEQGGEPGAAPVATTRLPAENQPLGGGVPIDPEVTPAAEAPRGDLSPDTGMSPGDLTASPPTEAGPPPQLVPHIAASVVRSAGNAIEADEPAPLVVPSTLAPGRKSQGTAEAAAPQPVQAQPAPAPANREAVSTPAPAAPAPPQLPDVPPAVQQVGRAVLERIEQGGGEARLHLEPADLGSVTIHVQAHGDRVTIDIHAERGEAMQILRDHTQDLSQLLGGRGLHLSDVSVGLGGGHSQSQQQGEQQGSPRNEPSPGGFASVLGIEPAAEVGRHNRLRAAYNPDGAHVYRV
ncbi:MAG: flagellar hook-length control protein FliK [Chloroflexi bacterium]|nr:flagellar hook-length control protein FliK [Chloroflexota bacterium]